MVNESKTPMGHIKIYLNLTYRHQVLADIIIKITCRREHFSFNLSLKENYNVHFEDLCIKFIENNKSLSLIVYMYKVFKNLEFNRRRRRKC